MGLGCRHGDYAAGTRRPRDLTLTDRVGTRFRASAPLPVVKPVCKTNRVTVVDPGNRQIGAQVASGKPVNVHHVIDVVAVRSTPAYASNRVLPARARIKKAVRVDLATALRNAVYWPIVVSYLDTL